MAILTNGIIGSASGRVGNLIFCMGSTRKNYVRSAPRKSTIKASPQQEKHRSKFKFASLFLGQFKDIIKIGFPKQNKLTSMNRAMKDLLYRGIIGEYPEWKIDFPRLRLSRGSTPQLPNLEMILRKGNEVHLKWVAQQFSNFDSAQNDLVRVILYNSVERCFVVNQQAFRCDEQCFVQLSNGFKGDEVHVYVMVHSLRGTPSDSQYVGVAHCR